MTYEQIASMAQKSSLQQITVDNDTVMDFIHLGLIELYSRFNLKVETEILRTEPEATVYDLRSADILQVIGIYNHCGRELAPHHIINDDTWDYKQLNYRSFIFREPKSENIMFVYTAAPAYNVDKNAILPLPQAFISALMDYIAYKGHSTINRDNNNEADTYYARFERSVAVLDGLGYRVNISQATLSVQDKGFI